MPINTPVPDPRDHADLSYLPSPTTGPGHPATEASHGRAASGGEGGGGREGGGGGGRPWLSLWFSCANVYTRAYRNAQGTGYTGRCPRCGKSVRFMIGPGGTSQRMFEVRC